MTEKIVIIGAGAAGIGAGLALQALAVPFVILEASDRVGGRAYTDKTSFTTHWDQGCSWLHCADVNPLVSWADKLGAVYESEDHSEKALFWSENHWLDMPERSSVHRHITNRFASIYATAKQGHDVPISAIPDHDGIGAVIAKTMVQLMCSDEPERASAAGYADYIDTNVNWVVTSGYGDLINRMAVGLPIRTGTEVSAITYRRGGVSVQTNSGQIDARAAIVTTSTNVLRSGKIDFPSGPVQQLLNLIEEVPCGTYEKIAIALDHYPFDPLDNEAVWINPDPGINPVYFQIARGGQPMLIAHVAGSQARDLVNAGANAMVDFATQNLTTAFGSSVQKLICGTAATSWQTNRFIQGGYSCARPGAGNNRRNMIDLDTGVIAFAGEAFSLPWYGTAHGAYQSGKDVASRLALHLNLKKSNLNRS